MPLLLGFINNNNSNNASKNSPTTSATLSRRRQRKNTGDTGTLQEPANSRSTAKPHHLATPAEKCSPTITELKITPPFPALKVSLSLRSKSNPRASRHTSRSPSPTSDAAFSPVLAPSPIITRTTSNGDGLLTSDTLCTGDYWSEDQSNNENQVTPSDPARELWSKRSSEHISVTPELVTDTPRITITAFKQSPPTMADIETPQQAIMNDASSVSGPARSVSESLVNFARRSWSSPAVSRSSSPSSRDAVSTKSGDSSTTASSTSSAPPTTPSNGNGSTPPKFSRRNSISSVRSRRPISAMFGRGSISDSTILTAKTQSLSADNLPMKFPGRRIRDDLWDSFRTLENDYNRFQSKSSTQKANIIRQSLMPFLRNSTHATYNIIEPDELDRRARVLHRWWTGLLAQLQNRSPTAIAGSDRPLYLEGISAIMSRPEWRPPQSEFSPFAEQIPKSQSSTSLSSDSSRYSVEKSVQHNIKALFTRTIIDTLAYAVDKMGQRSAPASLVAFAGKVVAYAFYFCNGTAEVLISLWNIPAATLTRVLRQNGIQRSTDLHHLSDDVIIRFPECLHSLGFSSSAGPLRQLKKSIKPPLGNTVDWYGAWVNRWLGRDSDLLFVFLKYYHILLCEFLPPEASEISQACAPGFIFVQAHMLNIMDSTVHSKPQKAVPGPMEPSLISIDDVVAKASTLAAPTHRTMAENKLVVLLRDVLTDHQLCTVRCRGVLSRSFSAMLMAAAQRTKVFDSDACFTLCDIIEETLPILNFSEKLVGGDVEYINWPFWLDVFKRMSSCDNNMTELRLICMVYTIWKLLVEDDKRKRSLCLEWLLSPPIWERFFCHWCPMVRAYFMRLICWRMSRFTGSEASELDKEILQAVFIRLRTCYAHHTRLKEKAEKGLIALPSTTPNLPAPGRRLIILRNDAIIPPPGIFFAEDGLITISRVTTANKPPLSPGRLSPNERPSTPVKSAGDGKTNDSGSSAKKKWSLLRTLGLSNSPSPPGSPESPLKNQTSFGELGMDLPEVPNSASLQRKATFKFSLEWMAQQPFNVRDKHLNPARLPVLSQNYIDSLGEEIPGVIDISECKNLAAGHWTYSGRALAEWVLVIIEYENFFERRKSEGKESDKEVETPSLGVESLRKL